MARPISKRGEARREAILAAALRCFRESGFQGTGVAAICKAAGISPGHLYHYFDSKEAIVEAIVEGDRARMVEIIAEMKRRSDPFGALMAAATETKHDDYGLALDTALTVEIAAEALRNPRVAEILLRLDRDARAEIATLLMHAQAEGRMDPGLDAADAAVALLTLIDGLQFRAISDPEQDLSRTRPIFRRMLETWFRPKV